MKRDRVRNFAALAVGLTLLAAYAVIWFGVSRQEIGRSDFTSTYVGAYLWSHGHHADLYDRNLQTQVHSALIAPDKEGNLPFVNPPLAAVVATPLTALSLDTAYRVFAILQVTLLVGSVLLVLVTGRRREQFSAAAFALAIPGTLALALLAQWDGVSALGLAAGYVAIKSGRRGLGGCLLAATLLLAKPHLALGIACFLLGWRDRRVIAGAAAGAAAIVLLNLAAVGFSGLQGFAGIEGYDASRWALSSFLGYNGFFASWVNNAAVAQSMGAVCSVLVLVACVSAGLRLSKGSALEMELPFVVALSLVASPHLLTQDLVLLCPMLVLVVRSLRNDRALLGWAGLCLCSFADIGNQSLAPPGRLVPVALTAIAFFLQRQHYEATTGGVAA